MILSDFIDSFLKYGHVAMFMILVVLLSVIIILLTKHEHLAFQAKQTKEIQLSIQHKQLAETLNVLYEYFLRWQNDVKDWDELLLKVDMHCNAFATRLRKSHPKLSEQDIHFSVLLLLKVPRTLIADSLHIAVSTISKKKHRLAHSIGVETNQLYEYLVNFCLYMHDDTTNHCHPTQSIGVL